MRYPRRCTRFPWQVRVIAPLICFCYLIALISAAAGAEQVTELWRGGGFDWPYSVSVNPADGSCWVADSLNNQVVHLAQNGTQLWRSAGYPTFNEPVSVSVNPGDGSCWVADTENNQVVHLAQNGTELWRSAAYPTFYSPRSVSVNPRDGDCGPPTERSPPGRGPSAAGYPARSAE